MECSRYSLEGKLGIEPGKMNFRVVANTGFANYDQCNVGYESKKFLLLLLELST